MMTFKRAVAFAALLAAALISAGAGKAENNKAGERSVSVSATGNIAAEPDVAYVTTGVVAEAETARDALARNNAAMAKLVEGLKAQGISPKDIQTTTINVEARYTQSKDGRPTNIGGYRVVNQVRLAVREVKKLGDILDQAIVLGANQINRIAFEVVEAESLLDQARKRAMENARRRAELYAAAAGAQLGPVVRISEATSDTSPAPYAARSLRSSGNVPIEAGTRTLEVEVHVTYALK